MFIKRDTRKVSEILQEAIEAPVEELKFARRPQELKGTIAVLRKSAFAQALIPVEKMTLYSNDLKCLKGISVFAPHARLQELNLGLNQLTTLPAELGQVLSLRKLWLDDNQLTEFPECLLDLSLLQVLRLSSNRIPRIPPTIRLLKELQELAVDHNELTDLPATVGELDHLEILNLRQNKLTSLPSSLGRLQRLRVLTVSSNQLQTLTRESIESLHGLQRLHLNSNQLTDFPSCLLAGSLTNLVHLNLSNNQISVIPRPAVEVWGRLDTKTWTLSGETTVLLAGNSKDLQEEVGDALLDMDVEVNQQVQDGPVESGEAMEE